MPSRTIYTIGHSTHPIEILIAMLGSFGIEAVADIRRFPGSRRHPQYNSEALAVSLPSAGIQYLHMPELGGRRKPLLDSRHTAWRNDAFRGYADYMDTGEFAAAIRRLQYLGETRVTAYMCSEAVWWRCHRALVSDFLKNAGWKVMHIMEVDKATEHPYTAPARENQAKLF